MRSSAQKKKRPAMHVQQTMQKRQQTPTSYSHHPPKKNEMERTHVRNRKLHPRIEKHYHTTSYQLKKKENKGMHLQLRCCLLCPAY